MVSSFLLKFFSFVCFQIFELSNLELFNLEVPNLELPNTNVLRTLFYSVFDIEPFFL